MPESTPAEIKQATDRCIVARENLERAVIGLRLATTMAEVVLTRADLSEESIASGHTPAGLLPLVDAYLNMPVADEVSDLLLR